MAIKSTRRKRRETMQEKFVRIGNIEDPQDVYDCTCSDGEFMEGTSWQARCSYHFRPFSLRPYQFTGIKFLQDSKRAMLTDMPGLGKTPQSAFAAVGRVLIICPNYLTEQWYDWLLGRDEKSRERNQGLAIPNVEGKVAIAIGNSVRKYRAIVRSKARWTVINMEALPTHSEWLCGWKMDADNKFVKVGEGQHYDTVIIDEAHHMRNRKSIRAKVALQIAKQCERIYELTASPIYREVDDLYQELRILQPDIFTSYNDFVKTFCVADDTRFGLKVVGIKKSMIKELEQLLSIVKLGRSYREAGRNLPPIIETFVKIEMPPHIKKMYQQAIEEYRIEAMDEKFTNWMSVFHTLRRIVTGSFKYDAVKELLADEVRKAVIFSWYQDTAEAIAERFSGADMEVVSGSDKVHERRTKALGHKHVSATIASLGEGIDLSDARTAIFAEENWTPGSNFQALSRVVRERQGGNNDEPVRVIYVHVKGTIDEVIHRRSRAREGTIKDLILEALY